MNQEAIFAVKGVVRDRSGATIFVGCADHGTSVRVGDKFTVFGISQNDMAKALAGIFPLCV